MRKFLISAAVAASALAVASPAAAQYYPQPQGNAYGYNNNRGQAQRLQVRLDQIRRQIVQLDRRNILSNGEARRLSGQATDLQRRLRALGYNGLNSRERYDIERRIVALESRVRRDANDGNRWGQRDGRNGGWDRDRDGRDDRYEDDQGTRRD